MTTIRRCYIQLIGSALLTLILANSILAQTTRFTYQGLLTDGGNPANGAYDLQFKLFSVLSGGAQQGTTVLLEDVPASNGIFKVTLDFGAPDFPGADRFLEISVRPGASTGTYTTLAPRQQLTSSPYAIRTLSAAAADSLSAACVNCVTSGQIASVAGSQVTGILPVTVVPAGSGNYIQNTTTPQAGSNFNISGDGVIGGNLGIGTNSLAHALQVNGVTSLGAPGGVYGFSVNAGSPGPYPSLGFNAFVNANASAYLAGTTGFGSLFQFQAGDGSLYYSTSPSVAAGATRTFNTRFSILQNGNIGIGTSTPGFQLHVNGNVATNLIYGQNNSASINAVGVAGSADNGIGIVGTAINGKGIVGSAFGANGIGVEAAGNGYIALFAHENSGSGYAGYFQGSVYMSPSLYVSGNIHATGTITQGSDVRLKQDIANLDYGLQEILRLRPVSWTWKQRLTAGLQLGLIAQEVEAVLPELVTISKDAEPVKGLNYIGLIPVLIKSTQEQQAQIEAQQKLITQQQEQIKQQQKQFDELKRMVCLDHSTAIPCQIKQ
ncbi:MAG: tail fiber domain-containing protein [Acidobacteria bacterium]|nr:tail fiber domain-containing protein [Acidobacteriota bacterium]